MRLCAAFLVAGIAASGTAHASSIVIVEASAASPSSVSVDAPKSASRSIVALGAAQVDAGKVAAIEAEPTSTNHKMGPELMVIRGGEVGSASPDTSAGAPVAAEAVPAQQAATGDQSPLPVAPDGTPIDPAPAHVKTE
ncbi:MULTISPECIES: hypothetical protein [Aminobacter]|jgi:hypothetical protein|uniref:Uncharacterized protein n=2 Tax=Aminobacter TaxID=31988 RepID=A0AAC8YST2_AMIAI|nr:MULTISPECIES: hypothetical protein [Aminobacter]AMS43782.1 hypothetical protein AA2016_4873 [Aminobacter aminovorans]MBA8908796.1 hypothetical protein [Aminobacter ciceronei]MBA9022483.1 hypothetical protein [Aminobacter ciceronei]MBB3707392.1 hypothetical protein [Aminobacter aminovorans]MRX36296.1 hypothetical protein [Aminobacter sp. MDW-2]